MKKIKITFEASERNGNSTKEQTFELMVDNMVAKDLINPSNTFCKTMIKTIIEIMATLQTGDIFAKSIILNMEELSNGNC